MATAAATLATTDFVPFMALAAMPAAMVAHVLYRDLDPVLPASISPTVIGGTVRGAIGFDGLLFSDDLDMQALSGAPGDRAAAALAAGCDVAVQCNGDLTAMAAVVAAVPPLTEAAARRWERAKALVKPAGPVDMAQGYRELARLLPTLPQQA